MIHAFVSGAVLAGSAMTASALHAQASPSAPMPAALVTARLDEYLTRLESLGFSGGLLFIRDGRTLLKRSYGFANRDAGIRGDTATVYNLGSITKQFTAAAILRLEELGRLRTSDPISRYFKQVPDDKRAITLHHLLTHTSGLETDFSPSDYEPTTRDEYVRRALASQLRTPVGQSFSYANSGYSLLAAVVEIVMGKDYEEALAELVLRPAGMLETGYKAPQWPAQRLAHGYQGDRDWGTIVARLSPPGAPYWALRGNGGLHTTLSDMQRWDAAQNTRVVLTDSSRRKFTFPYVNEQPAGFSQYAYGWAVMHTPRGTRLVTHNGGNGVYVAEFLRFVDEGVTLFLTSTVAEIPASPVVGQLTRIIFGEPYQLPPRRVPVAAAALARMAGSYRGPDGSHIALRADGGQLLADADGQIAWLLLHTGDTTAPPRAAAVNASASAIVAALVRGEAGPLHDALDAAPDTAALGREERRLMTDRRERLGAFRAFTVLGTLQPPRGPLQTTVRIDFERGAATNIYGWNAAGRLVDVGARPYRSTVLIAADGGEFRAFDIRSGGGGGRFSVEPDGTALLARTGAGTVRLVRE